MLDDSGDPSRGPAITIGALVPQSRPGWVQAGRHLLAGLELAAREVNDSGGVDGRPLELAVRDTAADPERATAAIDELERAGVACVAGEYHSVVARAAAGRADALGVPFLCSSAVLDALVQRPSEWVARIAPPQSLGWRIYADFLRDSGHERIAVATEPSVYWQSGTEILRERLSVGGGEVVELPVRERAPAELCDELAGSGVTALLLLLGYPEPAASIVTAIRRDARLSELMLGAPAGQPEFADWSQALGDDGAGIPFLRYLPAQLDPLGARVAASLRDVLGEPPSFVALEGYDTIAVLAHVLRGAGPDRAAVAGAWPRVAVPGTRGEIRFQRTAATGVWQRTGSPVQVVAGDRGRPDGVRVLVQSGAGPGPSDSVETTS